MIYRYLDWKAAVETNFILNIAFLLAYGWQQFLSVFGTAAACRLSICGSGWAGGKRFRLFYLVFYPLHMATFYLLKCVKQPD